MVSNQDALKFNDYLAVLARKVSRLKEVPHSIASNALPKEVAPHLCVLDDFKWGRITGTLRNQVHQGDSCRKMRKESPVCPTCAAKRTQ